MKPILLLRGRFLLLILFSSFTFSYSQNSIISIDKMKKDKRVSSFALNEKRETPSLISFEGSATQLKVLEVPQFLDESFGLNDQGTSFVMMNAPANQDKAVYAQKFQEYHNGIKVEHGVYTALVNNKSVRALTGEFYTLDKNLASTPSLTEEQALQYAKQFVGAKKYVWEVIAEENAKTVNNTLIERLNTAYKKYFPKGELVYVDNYYTDELDLRLAYKFNIYASAPLSRSYVYVDAVSGEILLNDAIIKHASDEEEVTIANVIATGDTRYAGTRQFDTTLDGSDYILSGVAVDGVENETRSMNGLGGLPISLPALYEFSTAITDDDNNWSSAEHRTNDFSLPYPIHNEFNNDDVALDAHWGAEIVLKYWFEKHGRSSYDGNGTKVFNFVHYGDAYDNAFWNGEAMTYGDGSAQQGLGGGFLPLTSMDVCAHEIGHGVCEFTSDLVYESESGAMNEGFSDIWAACVEHYVLTEIDGTLPYQPFGIGEQIDNYDEGVGPGTPDTTALRWMDDPKAEGDPDCYGGDNWQDPNCTPTLVNDYCGVHGNSGVLNKWFYFLVQGSGQAYSPGAGKASGDDGITDGGRNYEFDGLGFEKAEQIAFLGETMLSPNATFEEMRTASILAAETLYGLSEVEIVTNAWFAVDIGEEFDPGEPDRIFFNSSNITATSETTPEQGCNVSKMIQLNITAIELPSTQTITIDPSASTATIGVDFDLPQTEVTFPSGSSSAVFEVEIFNDAVVETSEDISLSFTYNAETSTQNVNIGDDDIIPVISNEPQMIFAEETFDVSEMPAGWSEITVAEVSSAHWAFNGTGDGAGKAFATSGTTNTPTYDIAAAANVILVSPMINAIGQKDVQVKFDWQAGGEHDLLDGTIFDYGEFLYSFDGANFVSVETYVGSAGGNVTESGTFDQVIPELENSQFVLGFRWYNDDLVGSSFSFTVDNVSVTATSPYVEMELDAIANQTINTSEEVYFLSTQNGNVMAKIENASEELGCVEMTVVEAGSGSIVEMTNIDAVRASKVIKVTADGANAENASYDITLYFANSELVEFTASEDLKVIKVDSDNIDDASDALGNYTVTGALLEDNVDAQYKTYKASFTGFGTYSVAEGEEVLGTADFTNSNLVMYPTLVTQGNAVNIEANFVIENITVIDIRGAVIKTIDFAGAERVDFNTAAMRSGMYFVTVNGNRAQTLRLIVK